jgi:uncharacterized integral membrane protein (TIGR00698 family)
MIWIQKHFQGIALAFMLSVIASMLGSVIPLVGGAVFGILFGMTVATCISLPTGTAPGLTFTSKKILQWAIIVLGSGLSLGQVYKTGSSSFLIILTTITVAFIVAAVIGKLLHVSFNLTSLIGVGTAICGGSAIAAVAPVIEAEEQEVAYAISTVFLFNVIAVLVFPPLGHLLNMSQLGFGMFAGTAINDTSSVVAAGYIYGNSAGDYATIVKLTRTVMIVPIAVAFVFLMYMRQRREAQHDGKSSFSFTKTFPWFIVGFILASALNTSGVLSPHLIMFLKEAGKFMIVMALTAIGLKTDFKKMVHTGLRPAILGLTVWIAVALMSVFIQRLMRQW